jgi:hypothetical protein
MAELQTSKGTNGAVQAPPPMTLEQLQAELARVSTALVAQMEENKRLKEAPVGAVYGTIPPSGKYLTPALQMTLPSGGRIFGPRKKYIELIQEVESGRMQAALDKFSEVK